jgi:membrane protein
MGTLKARFEALQRSRVGMFGKKLLDDQAPNLAALLAWGTLSTLLPLLLGILAIAGLVLRDPERLDRVYSTLLSALPPGQLGALDQALQGMRQAAAAPAGVVSLVLLLFNGSSFFANMAGVFDQTYHVESRNIVLQRVVAVIMLVVVSALLILSTLSLGIGSLLGSVPLGLGTNPLVAQLEGWSVSVLSAFLLFLMLYKVLPNARQGWRDVLPGTLLSSVLFFVILLVFPLYVAIFPPSHAYAVFGVFLVLTFWIYLLGWVFVLGAALNAFIQEPSRAVALAEATQRAQYGRARFARLDSQLEATSSGHAPLLQGGGPLGAPRRSLDAQLALSGGSFGGAQARCADCPARGPSITGRVLGFIGLVLAVLLLRQQSRTAVS